MISCDRCGSRLDLDAKLHRLRLEDGTEKHQLALTTSRHFCSRCLASVERKIKDEFNFIEPRCSPPPVVSPPAPA